MFDAIGNTPVIRLSTLGPPGAAAVWVKLEGGNPTGSYKDRMALAMIRGAERRGALASGQPVVEYTGGSTGSSLAFVCSITGHPLRIVTSDAFSPEKIATMRAFGARLEVLESPQGITPELVPRMRARAAEIARDEDAYATDQFNNTDMVEGYRRLGEELAEQVPGPIDAFCGFVGTAGCFLGVTRVLRQRNPDLLRVVVEPAESAVLSGGPPGVHRFEGGGVGFRPPLLEDAEFDEVMAVGQDEAFAMLRRAARVEGIFSGPSTAANLVAALRLAVRLGPSATVATVAVDSGLKYLAGDSFAD